MSYRLRLDASRAGVLAYCTSCPSWRELRGARPSALLAAADHAQLVHGDSRRARKLREQARATAPRRHAE